MSFHRRNIVWSVWSASEATSDRPAAETNEPTIQLYMINLKAIH